MRKLYSIAAAAILGLVFQACGQKGPLRLPDRSKPPANTPTQATPTQTTPATPPDTAPKDNVKEP